MAHFDSLGSIPDGKLRKAIADALGADEREREQRKHPKQERKVRHKIQTAPLHLLIPCVPWSLNEEHQHWRFRHERTKEVRRAITVLVDPTVGHYEEPVAIEARPVGVKHDAGNTYPTVKAAVDGLIDAGVLKDDSPRYVRRVVMHAPIARAGRMRQGLDLVVFLDQQQSQA